jgi:Animal haem peroxidase
LKRRDFFKQALAGTAVTMAGPLRNAYANENAAESLARAGTAGPSSSTYTRRFSMGPPCDSKLEEGLRKLADSMMAAPDQARKSESDVEAGYTYFGQFIDHDLTLDLSPLDTPSSDAQTIPNFRTPFLDLDQIYGGGPNLSPFLYEKVTKNEDRGCEQFLIGKTNGGSPQYNDLPRNPQGVALTGDPRQDENLVLAQLHVAFLKLHNVVIGDEGMLTSSPHYRRLGESDFAAARRAVTWHYQWLVRNDYLSKILHPDVFKELPALEKTKLAAKTTFQIPIEFSVAAFRFGHSMVRDEYMFNGIQDAAHDGSVHLHDLFDQTGASEGFLALPTDWVIDWHRFFGTGSSSNKAQKIDTKISSGLYYLSIKTTKQFSVTSKPENAEAALPTRTLLRGSRMRLLTGQKVAEDLNVPRLKPQQILFGEDSKLLMRYGFETDTPLWFYILKESEVNNYQKPYDRLGRVGSWIVADTIVGALAADPASYLHADPKLENWEPTFKSDAPTTLPYSLKNLLEFIATTHGSST